MIGRRSHVWLVVVVVASAACDGTLGASSAGAPGNDPSLDDVSGAGPWVPAWTPQTEPPDEGIGLLPEPGADAGAGGAPDGGQLSGLDGGNLGAVDSGTPGSGPDAGVAPAPPRFEAVFSRRPATNGADLAVEQKLTSLIDLAVPGSRVRVAVFTFTRGGPADALVRAKNRGVDVKVVVDGDAPATSGSEVAALQAALGVARVHVCDAPGTACVGSGIMHHKTFLFSELSDGSRNVVVQASHNLTTRQLTMHNNALVIRGDAMLFAAYEKTWNDLERDVEVPGYYRIDDGAFATRAYFFPRPSGGDTVVSILDNITCDSTARVRVAMAFFTDARLGVAQALAARKAQGCDVQVVAGDDEIPLGSSVASTLSAGGVPVVRYPARGGGWSLHSKYLLIEARYAGSSGKRRLVFTGSHNWTGPALTINDETLLRVEDSAVFDAYLADWGRVRQAALTP